MRHLNKIVFLNSANIPYAEIMLDGNVHFSGTQGVGKSTILRALLFFYNADKMHLGIQPGHKSFDEFYFRYKNSFIVYEVLTDHGAYSILVARLQGKVVFRFIDAAYRKEWFVNADGTVEGDWINIRDRIGGNVDISAKIDSYELYRNIIFGNTQDKIHRYSKYAIVESARYQNIPRSIQNVFLNSKLDADFVKNTIIQSMSETEDAIRLDSYRHLVGRFEREFEDIDCWYRKDSKGDVTVRIKAAKVIDTYRLLIALGHEVVKTWHQLNFVVDSTRRQIPGVETEISSLREKAAALQKKLDSARQDFATDHDAIVKKLGACSARLADIRSKRKHYDDLGIRSMLELNAREPALESEKAQRQKLLDTLETEYKDITGKYMALYALLDAEYTTYENARKAELQQAREEAQNAREAAMQARDRRTRAANDSYNEWLTESEGRRQVLQQDFNIADKRLAELAHWHPMQTQVDDCDSEIRNLESTKRERKAAREVAENNLDRLTAEVNTRCENIRHEYELRTAAANGELEKLKAGLEETERLLERLDGSLYQWLVANRPGWEQNIGKVVDEQCVLYAQGLNPEPASGGDLFGVRIDLDAIPVHHRTPDEYRALRKEQTEAVRLKTEEIEALPQLCENEIAAARKAEKSRLDSLRQQLTDLKVELTQIPLQRKDAETRRRHLLEKEEKMREAERDKRTAAFSQAQIALDNEKKERDNRYAACQKECSRAENDFNASCRDVKKQIRALEARQAEELAAKKSDIISRRAETETHELDELKGKGADTTAIDRCRTEIGDISRTLERIARERDTVIGYRKDERELFSRETDYREEKRSLEAKDERLRRNHEEKCHRYEAEKNETSAALTAASKRLEEMNAGLRQYSQLRDVENIVPAALLNDDTHEKCSGDCAELVGRMRGAVNRRRMTGDELKRAINSFSSHFGSDNTFNFIIPQADEDYPAFAENLQEFIDNNKIEDYRKRLSDHYRHILLGISREMGMLMGHSAEIRKVISDVNRDFMEHNFAGVIRKIELRAEDSSDHLMQLMRSIRDFAEDNSLSLGEMNLFSDDGSDRVNSQAVDYLKRFMKQLQKEPSRASLTLSDTFRLQFNVQENDNSTGWVERISNVGSDGTDILVKAMVNIMLINVFKTKASRKNGDFIIHCMMDEIGKLHPTNVAGILQFANIRNIYLINSSPMGYNADKYRYNYLLTKDGKSRTHVKRLISTR